ncbi:hypothetical protein V8D89_000652 [Ganoderma adspersum]
MVPNLRDLQVGILGLRWVPEKAPALRRLSLWNSSPCLQSRLTFDKFLPILQSFSTTLEYLDLQWSPQFEVPRVSPNQGIEVMLPHLRTFILKSLFAVEVSALLSHLQLSEDADSDVNIELNVNISLEDGVLTLPHILSTDATRLPLLKFASAAHFTLDAGHMLINISAPAHGTGRSCALIKPTAGGALAGWQFTPSQAIRDFCTLLAHALLSALELQLVWPLRGEACAATGMFTFVFSTFHELEELVYSRGANEASDKQLLDVLVNSALPRLHMLRLGEWNGELVSSLVEVFQIRANGGLRLSQLDIQVVASGESVSGAALQELYGLVDGDVHVR